MTEVPPPIDPRYLVALEWTQRSMAACEDLEPTSALKQAAADQGIPWGEEMGKFVEWARAELLRKA